MLEVVPIEKEGNPLYPLPPDYEELTDKGKRLARVNACRQWLIPGDPEVTAHRRIISTWFFDKYYLHPDHENNFESGFYDDAPLPTPQIHWDMSRQWALYRMNVTKAPRGCAKSTHCRKDMLMCLLTAPLYSFVYATSSHDNAKHTGQIIRDQCYGNSRISDDFCESYKLETLKPTRGSRSTGIEYFYVNNGSWLRCVSAESRLRGLRPRRFRLDDPEYDEKASSQLQMFRDYMDRLLFKLAIPMVLRANTGIDWVGTFVSKRHYLWHAMLTHTLGGVERAVDPRFDHWARLGINAAYETEDGRMQSVWEEMWPSSIESKKKNGWTNKISIEEMPSIMGAAAFNAEMMGRPGDSGEQFFQWDPSPSGPHAWWLDEADPEILATNPRNSTSTICWISPKDGTTVRKKLQEFLNESRLFITVDTAFSENSTSDRRVCTLMAHHPGNVLFVMDMWSDRKTDAILEAKAFEMADKWRCPVIHVEVVKESFKLYRRFLATLQTRLTEQMAVGFVPAIKPLKIGTMSKIEKIETLDIRFEHKLLKLPLFKRGSQPGISRLCDQIESFNPDAPGGGLDKDDEIDTVSMSLFILRSNSVRKSLQEALEQNPMELLEKGITEIHGMPIIGGMDLNQIPAALIRKMADHQPEDKESAI
jgi:hypothetical protein